MAAGSHQSGTFASVLSREPSQWAVPWSKLICLFSRVGVEEGRGEGAAGCGEVCVYVRIHMRCAVLFGPLLDAAGSGSCGVHTIALALLGTSLSWKSLK